MKNHEHFQPKNPQQPWLIEPASKPGETRPYEVSSPDDPLPIWHESQKRTKYGNNQVTRAIASDVQHDWTVKKHELGIPSPAQKRAMLSELTKDRVEVLRLHGIDIMTTPLTLDQIQYLLEHDISQMAWDTDPTSSEGVTIYPSEEAWRIRLAIDAKNEK